MDSWIKRYKNHWNKNKKNSTFEINLIQKGLNDFKKINIITHEEVKPRFKKILPNKEYHFNYFFRNLSVFIANKY